MDRFRKRLRLFFAVILATAIFCLFWLKFSPTGKISHTYDFRHYSDFITKFRPPERAIEPENGTQKIIGDPVYFYLRSERGFDQAKMTIKYRASGFEPFLEIGPMADQMSWQFNLKPLENKILDDLSSSWPTIIEGDLLFLQRNKKYENIKDFLANLPVKEKIALYNYNLKEKLILPDYKKNAEARAINPSFIGPFQIYTYIKSEDLLFDFYFSDINKLKSQSNIGLALYYQDKLIASEALSDDGNTSGDGVKSEERNLKFDIKDLPEGVYKIVVQATSDIITEKIVSAQKKISFINKLSLGKKTEKTEKIEIFTDSHFLKAQTINPSSLQKISVFSGEIKLDEINLEETYKQYSAQKTFKGENIIVLEKSGLDLSGDGVFSFSADGLINPNFLRVYQGFEAEALGVDYILARYNPPRRENGWKIGEIDFDLSSAQLDDQNRYYFMLGAPGIGSGVLEVDDIRFDLIGATLFEKINKIFNK